MKATKKQIATMDQIMEAVVETDEWADIMASDPGIKLADKRYSQVMDKVRQLIDFELEDELGEAVTGCLSALECAAILYGISVAETIRTVSANPAAVSECVLERTGRAVQKKDVSGMSTKPLTPKEQEALRKLEDIVKGLGPDNPLTVLIWDMMVFTHDGLQDEITLAGYVKLLEKRQEGKAQ